MSDIYPTPVCVDTEPHLTPEEQEDWNQKIADGYVLEEDA